MATYRILLVAARPTRDLTMRIAGCESEDEAKAKAKALVEVERFKKCERVDA